MVCGGLAGIFGFRAADHQPDHALVAVGVHAQLGGGRRAGHCCRWDLYLLWQASALAGAGGAGLWIHADAQLVPVCRLRRGSAHGSGLHVAGPGQRDRCLATVGRSLGGHPHRAAVCRDRVVGVGAYPCAQGCDVRAGHRHPNGDGSRVRGEFHVSAGLHLFANHPDSGGTGADHDDGAPPGR